MRNSEAHYEFHLDNEFFASIDAPEIQKGNLDVTLDVHKSIGVYILNFHTKGVAVVSCDRCLDDMDVDICTDDTLKVKLGEAYSDGDDIVVVPEEDGHVNVAWFIYEFIALALPIKHVHAPGKCNKGMMDVLNQHLSVEASEEGEEYEGDGEVQGEGSTDPRWDELKKILNNNNK